MGDAAEPELTFEDALDRLKGVVQSLEDGQIGLQEALEQYQQGVGLLNHCYHLLRKTEQHILQLTGVTSTGQPVTEPFEPVEGGDKAKPGSDAASRRRKRGTTESNPDLPGFK